MLEKVLCQKFEQFWLKWHENLRVKYSALCLLQLCVTSKPMSAPLPISSFFLIEVKSTAPNYIYEKYSPTFDWNQSVVLTIRWCMGICMENTNCCCYLGILYLRHTFDTCWRHFPRQNTGRCSAVQTASSFVYLRPQHISSGHSLWSCNHAEVENVCLRGFSWRDL